jgi:3alpha(or 20beta)-hydroxysteroid dehydrogenase
MARLDGKVALVTGGGQGIGEAISRVFADEGAQVVIGDLPTSKGADTARDIGAGARFVPLDATQPESWAAVVEQIVSELGRIDILVNNAGFGGAAQIVEETVEAHRSMVDLNFTGVWAGLRATIPVMTRQGGGSIVNISSIDGLVGIAGMGTYTATKFAVTGLTKSVALEVGRDGIRVNSVHPGIIATPLTASKSPARRARMEKTVSRQPIARMGRPEEIAKAVLFFASDDSSFCTGSSLVVDGGAIAGPYRDPVEE